MSIMHSIHCRAALVASLLQFVSNIVFILVSGNAENRIKVVNLCWCFIRSDEEERNTNGADDQWVFDTVRIKENGSSHTSNPSLTASLLKVHPILLLQPHY